MKRLLLLMLICGNCYALPHWEKVTDYGLGETEIPSYRLAVPHGWLVIARLSTGSTMVFVQDSNHEWDIQGTKQCQLSPSY